MYYSKLECVERSVQILEGEEAPCDGDCGKPIGSNHQDSYFEVCDGGTLLYFCEDCETKRRHGKFDHE